MTTTAGCNRPRRYTIAHHKPPRAVLDGYDMILIMHCPDDPECPRRMIPDIQRRARNATVLLVSPIDAAGAPSEEDGPGCGIIRSPDGMLYLRCGLSRRAWREAEALLLRDCAGQSLSPVVFEYQK